MVLVACVGTAKIIQNITRRNASKCYAAANKWCFYFKCINISLKIIIVRRRPPTVNLIPPPALSPVIVLIILAFGKAVIKAVNKVMDTSLLTTDNNFIVSSKSGNFTESFISLRCDRKNLKVPLNDILYIESLKDYIKVVTINKTIITKQSISSIEEMLPKENFIRIHRSYIVVLNKIEFYTTEMVSIGKKELPISRSYKLQVESILNKG